MAGKQRQLKCFNCKEKFDREILIQYNNKNYCKECYNYVITEEKDKKMLHDYIMKKFNIPFVDVRLLKQIKTFREEYGYTYQGIGYTLWYLEYVEKRKLQKTLGLVPYYYEKAKKYSEEKQRILNSTNTKLAEEVIIKIDKKEKEQQHKGILRSRWIDISNI